MIRIVILIVVVVCSAYWSGQVVEACKAQRSVCELVILGGIR